MKSVENTFDPLLHYNFYSQGDASCVSWLTLTDLFHCLAGEGWRFHHWASVPASSAVLHQHSQHEGQEREEVCGPNDRCCYFRLETRSHIQASGIWDYKMTAAAQTHDSVQLQASSHAQAQTFLLLCPLGFHLHHVPCHTHVSVFCVCVFLGWHSPEVTSPDWQSVPTSTMKLLTLETFR